jgi:hypothetical protein
MDDDIGKQGAEENNPNPQRIRKTGSRKEGKIRRGFKVIAVYHK